MTVIIVTGASRGLGAATARIIAGLGANVVLNARSANSLENLAQEIAGEGVSALVVAGDVSQPHISQRIVDMTAGGRGNSNHGHRRPPGGDRDRDDEPVEALVRQYGRKTKGG